VFRRSHRHSALPAPGPDRVAVVTGASSGIGQAIALELGRRGHNLLLVARTTGPMEQVRDELATARPDVSAEIRACDLADASARATLIDELTARDVHIIVNSAGVATFGEFRTLDPSYERLQFELNATAVFELTSAVLPGMVAGGDAGIVNVGSVAGNAAIPNNATYVGTKALVNTFTEALHYELKEHRRPLHSPRTGAGAGGGEGRRAEDDRRPGHPGFRVDDVPGLRDGDPRRTCGEQAACRTRWPVEGGERPVHLPSPPPDRSGVRRGVLPHG
jgi:NADP-dependent 3-hydroxy acid dehydrogenase YdfG